MARLITETQVLNTDRFKDLSWAKAAPEQVIMLGGLGGIGSWTALFLSRAGFIVKGFDHDTVERHNLGGQLYSLKSVGRTKASALKKILEDLTPGHGFDGYSMKLLFSGKSNTDVVSPYVIAGFDNMKARKGLFETWIIACQGPAFPKKRPFFIDGRMRAEGFQLYFVDQTKKSQEAYAATLFDDKEVPDEVCTIKATSHVGAMIGTFITSMVANHFSDNDSDPRDIPFSVIVDLELFNININM